MNAEAKRDMNEFFQGLYNKYEAEILKDDAICKTDKQRTVFACKHYDQLVESGMPFSTIRVLNNKVHEINNCRLALMIAKRANAALRMREIFMNDF